MKEILAYELQPLFDKTDIKAKRTYKGEIWEVWEVDDYNFQLMEEMTEEVFEEVCPDGMWRYNEGSILGVPTDRYVVNGQNLIAWCGNGHWEERIEFESLLHYMEFEHGVSMCKNVCALAKDLAKYNHMTMAELFEKYQGDK